MLTLSKFIASRVPIMNKQALEGLCYHRFLNAINYIDNYIKYSCNSKTKTHLKYLGFREIHYKEEMKFIFKKSSKFIYDIAENDIYLVEFLFKYGEEEEERKYYFYIPYMEKGNIITLSDNKFLAMPVLADKVISIGDKVIFINILTAKYNFSRIYYTIIVNGKYTRIPVIVTQLYKNQSKKLEDTTKAHSLVFHYLLANYGYSATMKMILGFVPTPVYEYHKDDKMVISSTGIAPNGFMKHKNIYNPTNIKFLVDKDKFNENVNYCLGNVFYILDNFSDYISIDELDSTLLWKRLIGEIIHSGNHQLVYIMEKINAHFKDLNSSFDTITINKLKDINIEASSLMELLLVIFKNFNNWIMHADVKSLYYNKSYEVESFLLSRITSRITRAFLDLSKEELRINNILLESKIVDKILDKYFQTRAIFGIKKDKLYLTSIEYSGDHLYPKNTAMVVEQESEPININSTEVVTSDRKKINASMVTIGNILGLPKKNPTPIVRLNPYVNIDINNGTVLPHPEYNHIVNATSDLLNNIIISDSIEDNDVIINASEIDADDDAYQMDADSTDIVEDITDD